MESIIPNLSELFPPELADAGYILSPTAITSQPTQEIENGVPYIVGQQNDLTEFSAGGDLNHDMFSIKSANSDQCFIPKTHHAFLPILQSMIDCEYALDPQARERVFSIRASRHTAKAGERHQAHIPEWHDHQGEGDRIIQIISDTLPTLFRDAAKTITAPAGAIIRFDDRTIHRTPKADDADTRRTVLIFSSNTLDPFAPEYAKLCKQDRNPLQQKECQYSYWQNYGFNNEPLHEHWRQQARIVLASHPRQQPNKPLQPQTLRDYLQQQL